MIFPPASSQSGTLHFIPPNLSAFEPTKPLVRSANINTLIWIGGLFDTLLSVSYPLTIAQSLGPTWSMVNASLGSAGMSWGVSSIAKDAQEIGEIVAYFKDRRPGGKIVIMGHSTGCQDCMEYIVGTKAEERPSVDAVILQAPVSDREAIANELPEAFLHEANQLALRMCREGQEKDAMPSRLTKSLFGRAKITARRWLDIASPGPDHAGADDYFSSDLPNKRLKRTFGQIPAKTPLLILMSGDDESVPPSVDKGSLIHTWTDVVKEAGGKVDEINGGVIPGASHNYNGNPSEVVQDVVTRVVEFIRRLDAGEFGKVDVGSRI